MKNSLIFIFFSLYLWSCQQTDYKTIPAVEDGLINVVVEIPAGTNHKIEYNNATNSFENDLIDGQIRVIDFLPYPGNYGFVPSTYMNPVDGGDGDALDILVIGEAVPSGTILKAIPIGTLKLRDRGEVDTKIIAVPADETKRTMKVADFQTFLLQYDAAKQIIEDWFLNYKGFGKTEFIGWEDETYVWKEIEKWKVSQYPQ